MQTDRIDPILISVIANRLDSITKDMGQTMLRTSRSPIFSEARDFVTAIYDRQLRLVAQTAYIPILLAATPWAVRSIAETYADDTHEGDVFILNDPYRGNNHPPDFTIAKPVYIDGKLRFWSVTKGHQADTGGGGAAGYHPEARDIWDEGLRIPPAKLYEQGKVNRGLWEMIVSNVRLRFLVEGDLHCLVGAAGLGERNIIALVKRHGISVVEQVVEQLLAASEKHMREEIRAIPNGTYLAERQIDNDGIVYDLPVTIRVKAEVQDESVMFDYSGSDDQVPGYVNSPFANTASATYLALFTLVNPGVPHNEGAMRPVSVVAPSGSVVNPVEPAPSTACTVLTGETITEAVWLALSEVIPERVQAAWGRWCAPATTGINPRTGRPFGEIHFLSKGGGGATAGFDGWDHIGTAICLGGLRSPDPELHELVNPYFIEQFEYCQDSAGAGQWRGGMGVTYRWRVEADNISCANFGSGTHPATAPFGLRGGQGAPPNRQIFHYADGRTEEVMANSTNILSKGDEVELLSSGGGGFGDPKRRAIEKVVQDVKDGLVSMESARRDYGVVMDSTTFVADEAATARLRNER